MTFNLSAHISRLPSVYFRFIEGVRRRHDGAKGRASTLEGGQTGQVFIVGAGPGDADLLTVKAHKLLQSADVVLFDWLVDESVLAVIPRHVRTEFVGKRSGRHSMPQADICSRLVALAQQGFRVVRLKGGDPAVFARTCEETDALTQAGIPFAIVPGITAASGASAYTGIPLTDRRCSRAVTLMTAHMQDPDEEPDWQRIQQALKTETVVLYMGLKRLSQITQRLMGAGVALDLPVAVIENACCINQFVITGPLNEIAEKVQAANLKGPALLIFGEVVSARQQVDPALLQQIAHVTPI
ncbi:uroporphyrinogen-III C-methyltransferase [Alteromonas aestuariivivens]|uniref:uroporphyrinogen-III C-methyltransferase n=1 Tax=Alteromonas aestuariivivens TaxID=1938339 RepID=A0A3D8MC99_9ALTE|nr:uroporphyrinogen-III C-methyltransferase [Alteromonas aestuariivivens]RDV28021.1 uroporphyrinogen-III C-methyltransferase [Alteromonas aestuariivivens]